MQGTNRDAWHGLRGNLLLQSLSPRDALVLAPHLRRVYLSPGALLATGAGSDALVYFPETLIACLGGQADVLGACEIGLVGREGMIGWDALLGCAPGRHRARAQLAGGTALAIAASSVCMICAAHPTLAEALLRFGLVFSIQMAGTLVSNLHDSHERRLSRWLLMFHDRLDGDELAITHDALAALLNVRRASVTDALHLLEGDRVLRCTRGRIVVRDRAGLELRAAHAYGAAEQSYRGAIGRFGKSAVRST